VISATILHEAEVELWEAVAYYEEQSAGLGLDFEIEIERTIQTIRHFPERWPLREDGTRRCLTQRFPYLIIYTHLKDHAWIVAFAHCKRRPGYWQDRLKAAEPADER
jgi:hypothetical protein